VALSRRRASFPPAIVAGTRSVPATLRHGERRHVPLELRNPRRAGEHRCRLDHLWFGQDLFIGAVGLCPLDFRWHVRLVFVIAERQAPVIVFVIAEGQAPVIAICVGRAVVVSETNQQRLLGRRPLLWIWKQGRKLVLGEPTAAHHLLSGGLRVRQALNQLPELSRLDVG
jgi:hypothetical protein